MYRALWEGLRLCVGAILGAWPFCWGIVFWLGFGQRTPRDFSLGCFLGSGVSSLFLSLPPFLLLLLFWGPAPARVPSLSFLLYACRQDTGLPVPGQGGASCTTFSLFSVSSLCPGRSPFPLSSPSFCPLSLSSSLFFFSLFLACISCQPGCVLRYPCPLYTYGIPNKHVSSARSAFVPALCTRTEFLTDMCSIVIPPWALASGCSSSGTLDPRVTYPGYGFP